MRDRWLWRLLLVACLASMATLTTAQAGAVVAEGGGSVTIDASRLNTVCPLDFLWRSYPGDSIAYTGD